VDEELDRFKRINLCEFAASRGYRLIRREKTRGGGSRGSTSSSLLMRHATTDDKIVVRLDRDEHWTYFSVRDDRDNGTIVDFLQHRGCRSLVDVRHELREWSGEQRSPVPPEYVPMHAAQPRDIRVLRETFARAHPRSSSPYLNSRGIRPETLQCQRFAGTWRVDDRGDLLFPHYDQLAGERGLCGFERKNARFAGFSAGGTKTIWTSNALEHDDKLVLTEAVIDAVSYHQVHQDPRARYASTGGSLGDRQARHVAGAIAQIARGGSVITAADNDEAGERLAARIGTLAGDVPVVRHRSPVGKDWNDYLQRHERDYIRSLGLRGRDLGR
jgi:Toprim domain-containing protein/uncharacterized protein DUF3991